MDKNEPIGGLSLVRDVDREPSLYSLFIGGFYQGLGGLGEPPHEQFCKIIFAQ